jgi:hypothetical protein
MTLIHYFVVVVVFKTNSLTNELINFLVFAKQKERMGEEEGIISKKGKTKTAAAERASESTT